VENRGLPRFLPLNTSLLQVVGQAILAAAGQGDTGLLHRFLLLRQPDIRLPLERGVAVATVQIPYLVRLRQLAAAEEVLLLVVLVLQGVLVVVLVTTPRELVELPLLVRVMQAAMALEAAHLVARVVAVVLAQQVLMAHLAGLAWRRDLSDLEAATVA